LYARLALNLNILLVIVLIQSVVALIATKIYLIQVLNGGFLAAWDIEPVTALATIGSRTVCIMEDLALSPVSQGCMDLHHTAAGRVHMEVA
jgi:hypothetical protein